MTAAPQRALVLCAGRGERLRPLTDRVPKPLMPVLGAPLVSHTLAALAASGVNAVVMNLHHLGEQMPGALGDRLDGMELSYSTESTLLGTLGPFGRLGSFFDHEDTVLLVNGDSLCRWPVQSVVESHRRGDADATLLLSTRADPARFGGGVVTDSEGRVLSFRGEGADDPDSRVGVFAGFHAIAAALVADVEPRPADIVRDLYEPLIASGGTVRCVFTNRRWQDMGTPARYLAGVLEAASDGSGGTWCAHGAVVSRGAMVSSSVLEPGTVVEGDAVIDSTVLMTGARVPSGAEVTGSILGPGVVISPEAGVAGQLVTRHFEGFEPRVRDTVIGDLVYTPIGENG